MSFNLHLNHILDSGSSYAFDVSEETFGSSQDHVKLLEQYVMCCIENVSVSADADANYAFQFGRDNCASLKSNPQLPKIDSFLLKNCRSDQDSPVAQTKKWIRNGSFCSVRTAPGRFRAAVDDKSELVVYCHQLQSSLESGRPVWL